MKSLRLYKLLIVMLILSTIYNADAADLTREAINNFATVYHDQESQANNQEFGNTFNLACGIFDDNIQSVQSAYQSGTSLDKVELGSTTVIPIIMAARAGFKDIVHFLIGTGIDINTQNEYGHTPLMAAIMGNHVDTIELLLELGADVNWKDGSPLKLAVSKGNKIVIKMLIDKGADINAQRTYLVICALYSKHLSVAKLLFDYIFKDNKKYTYLTSCINAATKIIEPMVKVPANLLNRIVTKHAAKKLVGAALFGTSMYAAYKVLPGIFSYAYNRFAHKI